MDEDGGGIFPNPDGADPRGPVVLVKIGDSCGAIRDEIAIEQDELGGDLPTANAVEELRAVLFCKHHAKLVMQEGVEIGMWAEGGADAPAVENRFRGGGVFENKPDFAEGLIVSLACYVADLLERLSAQGGKQQRGGGVSQSEQGQGNGDEQSAGPDRSVEAVVQDIWMGGSDTIREEPDEQRKRPHAFQPVGPAPLPPLQAQRGGGIDDVGQAIPGENGAKGKIHQVVLGVGDRNEEGPEKQPDAIENEDVIAAADGRRAENVQENAGESCQRKSRLDWILTGNAREVASAWKMLLPAQVPQEVVLDEFSETVLDRKEVRDDEKGEAKSETGDEAVSQPLVEPAAAARVGDVPEKGQGHGGAGEEHLGCAEDGRSDQPSAGEELPGGSSQSRLPGFRPAKERPD